jgi:hypothetical protein
MTDCGFHSDLIINFGSFVFAMPARLVCSVNNELYFRVEIVSLNPAVSATLPNRK